MKAWNLKFHWCKDICITYYLTITLKLNCSITNKRLSSKRLSHGCSNEMQSTSLLWYSLHAIWRLHYMQSVMGNLIHYFPQVRPRVFYCNLYHHYLPPRVFYCNSILYIYIYIYIYTYITQKIINFFPE